MLCFGLLIELVLAFLFFAVCIAPEIVALLTIALGHPHLLYKSEKLDVGRAFVSPSAIICSVGTYESSILFEATSSRM